MKPLIELLIVRGVKLLDTSIWLFSERELVHPTQAIEIFGNVSTPFSIRWPSIDMQVNLFFKFPQGNPSIGGVKH